ncbi:MAG: J domain-containing protein [Leptospirales bacterium]|nr:J domain-containing protein [Leptospirales bacterium]
MDRYRDYCNALGVGPGDNAETVKRAFRTRIKALHPDVTRNAKDEKQARFLIEAYEAFKQGVPVPEQPRVVRRPAAEQGVPMDAYQRGRTQGREAFERAMNGEGFLKDVFVNLSGRVFVDDPEDEPGDAAASSGSASYARNGFERTTQSDLDDILRGEFSGATESLSESREFFQRAEAALRNTVEKFERRENRFRRQWSRDYIADLTRVQVLFRDVARQHSTFSVRSLSRVRQIHELIAEIRKAAR